MTTADVDPEIAVVAGPQLVVPVDNARYALNAANARWGSLYDALYGTDVIPEDNGAEKGTAYNPVRGARVVEWTEGFLDEVAPLAEGSHRDAIAYELTGEEGAAALAVRLASGAVTALRDPGRFVGFRRGEGGLSTVLLRHHGLHIELRINRRHAVGAVHPAGVSDVQLEAAVTTIQDCEDSVAAVDAEDKVRVYGNWLGIMKGSLEATFTKNLETVTRRLNPDRSYEAPDGSELTLPGRSLLFVRNVGLHMYTDAVMTAEGEEVPEGFLDALMTVFAAVHDLRGTGAGTEFPDGEHLHREAEAPRPRGGRLHRPALRADRGGPRPPGADDQDRDHGRGAAHDGEPRTRASAR